MKTFLLVLFLFLVPVNAEEKDSTFCKYGFILDYKNFIANNIGFKYRLSPSTAFFLKGYYTWDGLSIESSAGISSEDKNIFSGTIGMEYTVFNIDNISFYAVISGALNIHTYKSPRLFNYELDIILYRKTNYLGYTIETGFGTEYFISKHLSIGGSQTIVANYFKEDVWDENDNPLNSYQIKWSFVNAKLTLSFYF